MTSGKMQLHCFGLLWLLTSVYIVRVSTSCTAAKRSRSAAFALIIQRPCIAGGLLTIPLDCTIQLLQSSVKDVDQNIIRLQYGPSGKHLVMRASNVVERERWHTAILSSLATVRSSTEFASPASRASYKPKPTSAMKERAVLSKTISTLAPRTLPSNSLDAIKRLADDYDNLALQWTQVAAESRQFSSHISSLQPPRIGTTAAK